MKGMSWSLIKRGAVLITVSVLVQVHVVVAQDITLSAQKTFGGTGNDYMHSAVAMDGAFVVVGYSNSPAGADKTEGNRGGFDYWVVKLDNALNEVWQKTLGGSGDDFPITPLVTQDGGLLLGGSSLSGISGDKTAPNKGGFDFWVIKLDAAGNELWQQSYGGSSDDNLARMVELPDGSILLAGSSASPVSGDKTVPSSGSFDYWVVSIDSDGNKLTDMAFGGEGEDRLANVVIVEEGFILSGMSNSNASGEKTENSFGLLDCWTIMLDENWSPIWDRTLGGSNEDRGGHAVVTGDRMLILSSSLSNVSGTKSESSRGGFDYWVSCMDLEGNLLWDRTIGGDATDQVSGFLRTMTDRVLICGGSNSDASFEKEQDAYGTGGVFFDFWPVTIDDEGQIIWSKTIGGTGQDFMSDAHETELGRFMLFGNSDSDISGDKTEESRGDEDFWIVEIVTPVGVAETEPLELRMAPNPAFEEVRVSLPSGSAPHLLTITDMQGRQVLSRQVVQGNATVSTGALPAGLYTITVQDGSGRAVSQRLVKLNR